MTSQVYKTDDESVLTFVLGHIFFWVGPHSTQIDTGRCHFDISAQMSEDEETSDLPRSDFLLAFSFSGNMPRCTRFKSAVCMFWMCEKRRMNSREKKRISS